MARLYMMRHGETLFNVLRRKQGWCDSPLTENGIAQAKRAGEWFREQGITFDHAYSSTPERCCDTLELAFPGLAYERDKGLREHGFGKCEGLTEDLDPAFPYGDYYVQFGGESDAQTQERIVRTLTKIMSRPDHQSVLAVSHAGACAMFLEHCGVSLEDLLARGFMLGNCCVFTYDFEPETGFELVSLDNPCE